MPPAAIRIAWIRHAVALVLALQCPPAPALAGPTPPRQVPFEKLVWGFCQVGGTGRRSVWPLNRAELEALRDDLHINAIRFFVHPAFVGLPQKSWAGPESLDYTRFAEADYVWRDPSTAVDSLDEVLDLLYSLNLHPVLLIFPVEEYVHHLSRDDLTFLNDPTRGLAYGAIRPVDQVEALTRAVARHVHRAFGDRFTLVYTEIAGQGEGAPARRHDRERWARIVRAARIEAPAATVASPELCVGMWWWSAAQAATRARARGSAPIPQDIPYTDTWPRGDRIENYRDVFDVLAISYYGMGPDSIEWKDVAATRPALVAGTEAALWVTRTHARPKQWLWAEAGWGSHLKDRSPFHLERDLATLLFGMDHCRGALLWQAKDNEGSGAGIFSADGKRAASYPLLKAVSDVVLANAAFFAADHRTCNADGFPVAQPGFRETHPSVLTRFLGRHVALFSEAPTLSQVTFTHTGGKGLKELPVGHGYSRPWPLKVTRGKGGAVMVGDIRPGLLYLLEVVP